MRRKRMTVAVLVAATTVMLRGQTLPPAVTGSGPALAAEPREWEVPYLIDDATGQLIPLERAEIKGCGGSRRWFEGASSSITLSSRETPLRFAVLLGSSEGRWNQRMEMLRKNPWRLEPLVVEKERRVAPRKSIPVTMAAVGQIRMGTHPKYPNYPAQTFILTAPLGLAPGEYTLSEFGMFPFPDSGCSQQAAFSLRAR